MHAVAVLRAFFQENLSGAATLTPLYPWVPHIQSSGPKQDAYAFRSSERQYPPSTAAWAACRRDWRRDFRHGGGAYAGT
ncbi:MAG: hypothetical protein CMH86_12160, partial [Oceanibulbus sp.]|nr:hypothetical protein [Sulfitobacter sp.]